MDGTAIKLAQIEEESRNQVSFKKAYAQVVGTPTFNMREDYQKFIDAFNAGCEGKQLPKAIKQKMAKLVKDAMSVTTDFRAGRLHDNVVWNERMKYISALAVPGMAALMDTFNIATVADMAADMNWMRAFRTIDMRGSMAGKIINFFLHAEIKELTPQESVPYGYIGTVTEESIDSGRYGGGFAFDRKWIANNGFLQLNDAIMALREENDITKSEASYLAMVQKIGGTEAFDTDPATTFNKAYNNLLDPLRTNKGYGITATTPVLAYHHPHHTQKVNQAIFALRGENGTNPVVEYNITPIPTYEVPKTLKENNTGTAHDAVMFVLPGRRILHVPQDGLSENQAFDWDKQVIKVGLQDFYKSTVKDAAQLRKVRLSS